MGVPSVKSKIDSQSLSGEWLYDKKKLRIKFDFERQSSNENKHDVKKLTVQSQTTEILLEET